MRIGGASEEMLRPVQMRLRNQSGRERRLKNERRKQALDCGNRAGIRISPCGADDDGRA